MPSFVAQLAGLHGARYLEKMRELLPPHLATKVYSTYYQYRDLTRHDTPPTQRGTWKLTGLCWIPFEATLDDDDEGKVGDEEAIRQALNGHNAYAVQKLFYVDAMYSDLKGACLPPVNHEEGFWRDIADKESIRINVLPNYRKTEVATALQENKVHLDPKGYTHLLHIVYEDDRMYWGLQQAGENEAYLDTRTTHNNRVGELCRAVHKLDAALTWSDIVIQPHWNIIDIGASPGGWSALCAKRVPLGLVHAVDPADLRVSPLPSNMIHWKAKIEDCMDQIKEKGLANFICIDINVHPRDASRLLNTLAPIIESNGHVICTAKMPMKTAFYADRMITEMQSIVSTDLYSFQGSTHLIQNTIKERTLHFKRL
jgi:23S rRNA U2552 (ribose-2'-O)-methylase RlmE/FtsJ